MKENTDKVRMVQAILSDLQSEYVSGNLTEKAYKKLSSEYEKKLVATEKKAIRVPSISSFFSRFFGFLMAVRCLKRHKARTALTVLGIVVGVTAIVSLNAVSEGMQQQMTGWIESSLGADLIVLGEGSNQFMPENRFPEDYAYTIASFSGVKSTGNLLFETGFVNGHSCLVEGTSSETAPSEITIVSGSFFAPNSGDEALIGLALRDRLSVEVGDYVKVESLESSREVRVIGVYQTLSVSLNEAVLMPFKVAQEIFGAEEESSAILVDVSDINMVESVKQEISHMFNGIQIVEQEAVLEMIKEGTNLLNMFLLAVASISLVVAGIGIMNTMFISVLERRREIGILKALGMKKAQVMQMFLLEAALIGMIGGGVGCLLGVVVSRVAESLATAFFQVPIAVQFSPKTLLFGFTFAVISAILSAVYPCWRATLLRPVECLKYE